MILGDTGYKYSDTDRKQSKLFAVNKIISLNLQDYADRMHTSLKQLHNTRKAYLNTLTKLVKMERSFKYRFSKKFRVKHGDLFISVVQKMDSTQKQADHYRHLQKDLYKQHELIRYLYKPTKF